MKYMVTWFEYKCYSDFIEAESVDEAKTKWEDFGIDGDLFLIEDEEGNQTIY